MERWKQIEGFEGYYEVSDGGRVRSVTRSHRLQSGSRTIPGKMKKPTEDKDGYLMVQLWRDNKPHPRKVHRLVGAAFLEKPEGSTDVNHKDGNKAHNAVSNLEWCTHKANGEHAARTTLMAHGSRHGIAKLTETDIPTIRKLYANGTGPTKIAKRFGVCAATIYDILKGKTWVRV